MDSNTLYQSETTGSKPSQYRTLTTQLLRQLKQTGQALAYSSVLLACIAMIEVAIATALLSLPPNPAPIVVGLVTFAVYTNDRLADADTDLLSNPGQAAFARRHKDSLYVLAALAYALAISIAVVGGPLAFLITLIPGLFWIVYASQWITSLDDRIRRLKNVLLVNTVLVALAWATCLTFLPVAFANASVTPAVGVVFAYFFLRSFVDVEIPNVRDIEADRAIGVVTIPVVFGVKRTRMALYAIDLTTAALVGYAVLNGVIPWTLAGALLIGICYSLGVVSRLGRHSNIDLLSNAPNFEYLLIGAVMLVSTVSF